jgi:hypothetical protein
MLESPHPLGTRPVRIFPLGAPQPTTR